jgi:hypothetical protein
MTKFPASSYTPFHLLHQKENFLYFSPAISGDIVVMALICQHSKFHTGLLHLLGAARIINYCIKDMAEVQKRTGCLSLRLDLMKEAVIGVLEFWNRIETQVDYLDKRQEVIACRVNMYDNVDSKSNNYIFRIRESNENRQLNFLNAMQNSIREVLILCYEKDGQILERVWGCVFGLLHCW